MSLEAWGDEDPADSLCEVKGCECDAYPGDYVCKCHAGYSLCHMCAVWCSPEDMHDTRCDDCYWDSRCEGE